MTFLELSVAHSCFFLSWCSCPHASTWSADRQPSAEFYSPASAARFHPQYHPGPEKIHDRNISEDKTTVMVMIKPP